MRAIFGITVCTLLALFAGAAGAQQRAPAQGNELPERDLLNAGTVTVITAPIGGPMSIMGSDMASVLDDGDKLRVLPILGKGSAQNLVDIIRLKNIDMGFVTSDALEFVKTEYNMPDIAKRVRYIARLFHNDIHIVARQGIRTLQDLNGKRVFAERSIGLPAARIIFRRMGIEADIDTQTDPDGGLQKLLSGERDAWIASVSKGAPVIKDIKNEGGKFHLLAIPYDRSHCRTSICRRLSRPRNIQTSCRRTPRSIPSPFHRADDVQLAARKRTLPQGRAVRRCVVRQDRAIAAAAASSEMERHRIIGQRRRTGTLQARSGLARQGPASGGNASGSDRCNSRRIP